MTEPPLSDPGDITVLLNKVREGDPQARDAAFEAIYGHLRRMAAGYMRRESPGHTLQPTALVHEVYLKLLGHGGVIHNRGHYFALAAAAMRRILVDRARAHAAEKRGGGAEIVELDANLAGSFEDPERVLSLNAALDRLQAIDPRKGQVVVMRFFGGLGEEEIAESLNVTVRTVRRDWDLAKKWLYAHLT